MPRISLITNNDSPDKNEPWFSYESEPFDFCNSCYTKALNNMLLKHGGEAVDGDTSHPDYEDTDYTCEMCNKRLTWRDD